MCAAFFMCSDFEEDQRMGHHSINTREALELFKRILTTMLRFGVELLKNDFDQLD